MDKKYELYKRIMKHIPNAIDEIETLDDAKEIIKMMSSSFYLNNEMYYLQKGYEDGKCICPDVIMSNFSKDFKEGYCDGHGQAIENVRYNISEYIKKNKGISIDKVNKICDFCSRVDEEYLSQ